jgi:hypothetical protein
MSDGHHLELLSNREEEVALGLVQRRPTSLQQYGCTASTAPKNVSSELSQVRHGTAPTAPSNASTEQCAGTHQVGTWDAEGMFNELSTAFIDGGGHWERPEIRRPAVRPSQPPRYRHRQPLSPNHVKEQGGPSRWQTGVVTCRQSRVRCWTTLGLTELRDEEEEEEESNGGWVSMSPASHLSDESEEHFRQFHIACDFSRLRVGSRTITTSQIVHVDVRECRQERERAREREKRESEREERERA